MENPAAPQTQQVYLAGTERGYPVTSASVPHRTNNHGVDPPPPPPPYRPNSTLTSVPESNTTKSHYPRNLYHPNHHPSGGTVSNNISNSSSITSGSTYSSSLPIASLSGGSSSTTNNFRASANQINPPISKVPHANQSLLPPSNPIFNSNSSFVPPPQQTFATNPLLNSSGTSGSPSLNLNSQIKSSKPNPTSGQFTGNFNDGHSVVSSVDVKGDGGLILETFSSVFNNEPFLNNSNNNSIRDAKCNRNVLPNNKKPALDRVSC